MPAARLQPKEQSVAPRVTAGRPAGRIRPEQGLVSCSPAHLGLVLHTPELPVQRQPPASGGPIFWFSVSRNAPWLRLSPHKLYAALWGHPHWLGSWARRTVGGWQGHSSPRVVTTLCLCGLGQDAHLCGPPSPVKWGERGAPWWGVGVGAG